jgi:anti-anti-sigma factor
MSKSLEVSIIETRDSAAAVTLRGCLDAEGTAVLKRECQKLLSQGFIHLIAGMEDVSFISSSGVGALLVADEDFEMAGGSMYCVTLSPEVQSVFKILDLEDVLTIAESTEEAFAALEARRTKSA